MANAKSSAREAIATDAVRREWRRRAEVEYRSSAYASQLTHWLLVMGAPPVILRRGLRIVGDEIAHAELSHHVYVAAGGTEAPQVSRESMELRRTANEPLEHDVTRVVVEVFCLGETVAVPLFHRLRRGCKVPVARKALDRVLRDEVRHRDFGWLTLEWLLSLPQAPALRALVTRELGGAFTRLRDAYVPTSLARPLRPHFDERDRAWGLMPVDEYAAALRETLPKMWVPRFAAHGLDAARACST